MVLLLLSENLLLRLLASGMFLLNQGNVIGSSEIRIGQLNGHLVLNFNLTQGGTPVKLLDFQNIHE